MQSVRSLSKRLKNVDKVAGSGILEFFRSRPGTDQEEIAQCLYRTLLTLQRVPAFNRPALLRQWAQNTTLIDKAREVGSNAALPGRRPSQVRLSKVMHL